MPANKATSLKKEAFTKQDELSQSGCQEGKGDQEEWKQEGGDDQEDELSQGEEWDKEYS